MFQPGDLLLVSRRRTLRSFFAGPITYLISRRIQRSTRSKWNHVACAINNIEFVEADFKGVNKVNITCYTLKRWKYELGHLAIENNKENRCLAAEFWKKQVGAHYDFKWLIGIRIWTLFFGLDGLKRIQAKTDDGFWICSELAKEGIKLTGYATTAITPADFVSLVNPPNVTLTLV